MDGSRVSLEPKEAQILKYILEHHQDGLISSESILDDNWDFWSDKKGVAKGAFHLAQKVQTGREH